MSWQASSWVLKTRVGDPSLKMLLLAIANYADPDGKCFPKVSTLAFDSEVSTRTIQRSLRKLEELGLIKITDQFNQNGSQINSLIQVLIEENEGGRQTVTPIPVTPDFVTPGVTSSCHGGGDNTVSPPESLEQSYEQPIEQVNKCPELSLGCTDEIFEAVPISKKEQAETFFDKQFWPAYPKRFGSNPKEPAKKKIVAAILKGEKPAEILLGVNRLYSGLERSGKLGTEFVPMALTWINRKGWKDDPLPAGNGRQINKRSFFELAEDLLGKSYDEPTHHDDFDPRA
jgi:hypothetical protein